ncbi:MAG: DUF721 domain-containing protein [Pseudomonadota bacterium]
MSFQGLKKLDELIFSIGKSYFGKKGVYYQKLLKDWGLIVGNNIARYAIPVKIITKRTKINEENVLFIATNNSASSTELVYHIGILKEQINFYFGYEYINQIKILQAVFKTEEEKLLPTQKKLTENQIQKVDELVSNYAQDDEIKRILLAFARDLV